MEFGCKVTILLTFLQIKCKCNLKLIISIWIFHICHVYHYKMSYISVLNLILCCYLIIENVWNFKIRFMKTETNRPIYLMIIMMTVLVYNNYLSCTYVSTNVIYYFMLEYLMLWFFQIWVQVTILFVYWTKHLVYSFTSSFKHSLYMYGQNILWDCNRCFGFAATNICQRNCWGEYGYTVQHILVRLTWSS